MKQIDHFTRTAGKQQSLKAGVVLLLMGVMLTLLPAALQAQPIKNFTQRTSNYSPNMPIYHIKGDYTMIGNTNLSNIDNLSSDNNTDDNNSSTTMYYVDVDGNTLYVDVDGNKFSTINSSTAALTFSDEFGANPACSEVLYAGLYWTGITDNTGMDLAVGTTLYDGDEIGGYTLNIDSSGSNGRIFTFTNGSETVELTMNRSRRQYQYQYYQYSVSNGGEEIYSGNSALAGITVHLPGTSNTITQLKWETSLRGTTLSAVVTTPLSKNKIKIRHDNAPGYTEVEAAPQDIYYDYQSTTTVSNRNKNVYIYTAYTEVTDYVRQYGLGNYTVADLLTEDGDGGTLGYFGCWGMVVVYENSKMKWRDITLFDGFANVSQDNPQQDISISGFKTVQVGDVHVKLGMMAAEGDRGITGDGCAIAKHAGGYQPLGHPNLTSNDDNFFNSSIETGGNYRYPNYVNNTGIDILMIELQDPEIFTNEQTETSFRFTTLSRDVNADGHDQYHPFCFVMGVDAYIPEAEALSGVMNIDEDDVTIDSETGNYLIEPGKEITFAVEVKNFGTEDIVDAKLEIPLPSTIEYYYAEVEYVYPGINIEGYYDAERYANGVAGWNIDYIPSGDPDQVYARVLLTVKVTDDCYVLASTDPECELAIEVNGSLEGISYVNRVYFKKESFISGFADETGCQGNAIRNDIKVVVNKDSYVNSNCTDQDYTVRLVTVCGNAFNATNPIPFMDIYALYPQGSRFFNATTGVEYTAATGFSISLAGTDSASAKLIHVQPTSIYSAACTSDLRFILDPNGDSFTTTPTLRDSATYCLDALADSLSRHITSTPPSDIYYRFYKERSDSAVAYVDIVPPTDVEDTLKYWVRQFRKNTIGCEDETFYGPITIKVVSPITFTSSKASPSCIGEAVRITGRPADGRWSWPDTLTGITVSDSVLIIDGNSAGTYTVTYTHNNAGSAGYNCTNTVRSYTHQIAATTNPGRLEANQIICQGAQIQPLRIVNHNGHVERWEWTTDTTTVWDWIPNNTSSISTADLGELAEGIYYFRALVKDGNCDTAWTNTVTITVRDDDAPNPPTVTSPQYACIGTDYTIAPSGDNYQWYEQAIGGWPIEDARGNPANSITVTITDEWITRYVSEVNALTGCVSDRAEVQVRPNLEPGAIATTGQRECDLHQTATTIGSNIDAVAYGEEGTVEYQWYYQVNGDTTLHKIDEATSATFTPLEFMDTEGDYIFIRKAKNSNCANWQQSRGEWRLVVGKPDASIEAVPGHATICQNGSIELRLRVPASTAYSYQWYKDGIAIPNETGHEYIATEAGRYTAQVTHRASDCSAITPESAIEVKYDDAAPTATSVTTELNGCSIADAQAVTKYSNVIDANASEFDFNISDEITPENLLTLACEDETVNSPTGVCYQLVRTYTVTDQCGFSTTFTHTINVVDDVVPSIGTIEVPAAVPAGSCKYKIPDLSAATLAVSSDNCSDVSFVEQMPAAGFEYSQTNTEQIVTVVVKVKDACNNETIKEVQITIPAIPTISAAGSALDCYGDSDGNISYTITGGTAGYTVVLSGGSATQTATPTPTAAGTYTFTGLAAGTYTVTVTDANGCTATASATVSEPSALTVSVAGTTSVKCYGGNDGAVNISVSGGTTPYRYVWSNGATTEGLSSVSAGTYTITVTDNNGCQVTASATVNQPAALTASATPTHVSCNGGEGSVALTVSGGTTPYSYVWSNGETSENLSSVQAGTYTVTVTDNNGCQVTASATVNQPAALTASATPTNALCNGGNGSVALTVSGGTTLSGGSYSYAWSNGATTEDLSSVSAGTYTVTVTDANGCQVTASATVNQPAALTASATPTHVSCNGGNGSVALTVSGGSTPYSYEWSNGAPTEDLSSVLAGTYTVTVTDANGCQVTASADVSQPSALTVTLNPKSETCAGNDGKINYTIAGGTAGYTVVLSGGSANQTVNQTAAGTYTFTDLKAGTYTVTVRDGNTCEATATATVTLSNNFTVTPSNTAVCSGETFTVNPTASHAAQYSWSAPSATGITGAAAGTDASNISGTLTNTTTSATNITYTVTATTTNGLCTADSFDVVVTVYAPVTGGSIQKDFIVCNGLDSVVTLTNSVSGNGGVNGAYIWQSVSNDTTITIVGANGEDYTPTRVVGTVQYQRVYTTGCGSQPSNPVSVTYYGNVNPGTVVCSNGCDTNYCYGSNINVTLSTSGISVQSGATPTIQWQQSVNGGEWTNIPDSNATTYTYNNANFTEPIKFRYTIKLPSCDSVPSNSVHSIGVWELPVVSITDVTTLWPSAASTDITGTIVTQTTPNYTYYWIPGSGLTLPNLPDPNLPESATSATSNTITGTFLTTNCNATYRASLYVVDGHGCTSNTATETFTVVDTEAPVISGILATINVEGCAETAAPAAYKTVTALIDAGLTITDICGLQEAVTSEQTSTGSCPIVITRTYTVKDKCGNSTTVSQTINVNDNTAPTITCSNSITQNTDDGQPYATVTLPNPTYGDNCSATYRISYSPATPKNATATNASGQYPLGETIVTYSVEDGCGNANSCSYTVTVTDDENPVISCPELSADNYSATTDDGVDTYTHRDTDWDATATDNDEISSLTYELNGATTGSGSSLENQVFNMGVTTVTWTVVDNSNLSATCSYTVTVTDDENPEIICPSDIAGIACITDVPAAYADYAAFQTAGGELTDNDEVDYASFALVDADTNGICPTTITRTYYIEDITGNSATCEQVITIKDSIAPALTGTWPANITGQDNCLANRIISGLYSNDQVKALYSDCSALTVTSSDTVTGDDCGWTVTRTYTITDACDNSVTKTMSVSGSDRTAPVLAGTWPSDSTGQNSCLVNADTTGLKDDSEIKDLYSDCSTITVTHTDTIEGNACGWIVTRTYTIKDSCGNTVTPAPTMSVSGSDQTAPVIESINLNSTLTSTNCVFTIPDMREDVRNISTDCSEITVTQPSAGMEVYPMVAERDTTVNVIVTDICGNSSVKEVIITIPAKVTISATATPAVICNGGTSQLLATAANVVGTAVYAWAPATELSSATIANPTVTLTASGASETVTYTVMVTDDNGCTATATASVTVNPEVVMNTVTDWTLCVGETSPEYVYTSTITDGTVTYGWSNDNSAIGLAASGTGNLPSFVAANATTANLIAEVKVAPTYTNNGISCQGDSINFHITVRPSINTPGNVAFTCPADTTVVLSYSECEQFVNIGEPEFVNNMSGMTVNITNDAPEGNIFPEGTTIVTWTATDECGAFLTCTQNVVVQFPSCGDSIADFDGYRYSSVRIGCQCWTGENARSEHYSDGTPVDNFRYYNDSDSLENIYGKLYTWYTAVRVPEGDDTAVPADSIDPLGNSYVQGICPEGWALPTVDEYMLMIANSGDATHAKDGSNLYWLPGYEGQPPFSGFDAYGAGKYNGAIDRYQDLLGKTYFWTTLSGSGSETATTVEINYYCAEGLQTELSKGDGVSIRCIRKR